MNLVLYRPCIQDRAHVPMDQLDETEVFICAIASASATASKSTTATEDESQDDVYPLTTTSSHVEPEIIDVGHKDVGFQCCVNPRYIIRRTVETQTPFAVSDTACQTEPQTPKKWHTMYEQCYSSDTQDQPSSPLSTGNDDWYDNMFYHLMTMRHHLTQVCQKQKMTAISDYPLTRKGN